MQGIISVSIPKKIKGLQTLIIGKVMERVRGG
jgi:hypothetical protein